MKRNATVFEYDPGWAEEMTFSAATSFWHLVTVLREAAALSGACVYANRIDYTYESYTLVFVNWTEKSTGDLEAWLRVNPGHCIVLKKSFELDTIIDEIRNLANGKDRFGNDPVSFAAVQPQVKENTSETQED